MHPLLDCKTHCWNGMLQKRFRLHRQWKPKSQRESDGNLLALAIWPSCIDVLSNVTRSDSSITSCTQKDSVTSIPANINSQNNQAEIEQPRIRLPLPTGEYGLKVKFNNGPHNVAYCFLKTDSSPPIFYWCCVERLIEDGQSTQLGPWAELHQECLHIPYLERVG